MDMGSPSHNGLFDMNSVYNQPIPELEVDNYSGNIGAAEPGSAIATTEPWVFYPNAPDDLIPCIGREFNTEDDAYTFYNAYAKYCGFSIRKGKTGKMASGVVNRRTFYCSKEGHRHRDPNNPRKYKERSLTRCGCNACLSIKLEKEGDSWVVTKFVDPHSHMLETPTKSRCLRSHKRVPEVDLHIAEGLHTFGVGPSTSVQYMRDQIGGAQHATYGVTEMYTALKKKRRQDQYNDTVAPLMDYLHSKIEEDNGFTYEFSVDEDDRLTGCFWVDSRSKIDYKVFGDVVCFDTTYKTNQYDMPFGPFVGVNHHKQTILLGAGLLFGETVDDFKWLFTVWLHGMGGVHPKSILIDQDPTIMRAIF